MYRAHTLVLTAAAFLIVVTSGCSDSTAPPDGADIAVTLDWSQPRDRGLRLVHWRLEMLGSSGVWTRCAWGSIHSATFTGRGYCHCSKGDRVRFVVYGHYSDSENECRIPHELNSCLSGSPMITMPAEPGCW